MKKDVPDSAELVRFSLVTLMTKAELSPRIVADRAKVSEKTVNNVLNGRHDTRLSVIERLARVFQRETWQMLRPSTAEDLLASEGLDTLIRNYLAASDRGKENIARVAELEARAQGGPQTGSPPQRSVNGRHAPLKP